MLAIRCRPLLCLASFSPRPLDLGDALTVDLVAYVVAWLDTARRDGDVRPFHNRRRCRRALALDWWTSWWCWRRWCVLAGLDIVVDGDLCDCALIFVLDCVELDEIARHQYLEGIDSVHKRSWLTVISLSRLCICSRVLRKHIDRIARTCVVNGGRNCSWCAEPYRRHRDPDLAQITGLLQALRSTCRVEMPG